MTKNTAPETEADESSPHKRTEVLSVKSSVPEKGMILKAAALYGIPYSEFMRMVSLTACRNLGITEEPGLTTDDVRRRRPRAKRVPPDIPAQDATDVVSVAV